MGAMKDIDIARREAAALARKKRREEEKQQHIESLHKDEPFDAVAGELKLLHALVRAQRRKHGELSTAYSKHTSFMTKCLSDIQQEWGKHEAELDGLGKSWKNEARKIDDLAARLDNHEKRLREIDGRLDETSKRIDDVARYQHGFNEGLAHRFNAIEQELKYVKGEALRPSPPTTLHSDAIREVRHEWNIVAMTLRRAFVVITALQNERSNLDPNNKHMSPPDAWYEGMEGDVDEEIATVLDMIDKKINPALTGGMHIESDPKKWAEWAKGKPAKNKGKPIAVIYKNPPGCYEPYGCVGPFYNIKDARDCIDQMDGGKADKWIVPLAKP